MERKKKEEKGKQKMARKFKVEFLDLWDSNCETKNNREIWKENVHKSHD